MKPAQRAKPALVDPATLPPIYRMETRGECMVPEIQNGTLVECSTDAPQPGELAVIWLKPERVRPGAPQATMKRLVMRPPSFVIFPWRDHPKSTVQPFVIVECNNPPKRFPILCADILAMHTCRGPVQGGQQIAAPPAEPALSLDEENLALRRERQARTRRRNAVARQWGPSWN